MSECFVYLTSIYAPLCLVLYNRHNEEINMRRKLLKSLKTVSALFHPEL